MSSLGERLYSLNPCDVLREGWRRALCYMCTVKRAARKIDECLSVLESWHSEVSTKLDKELLRRAFSFTYSIMFDPRPSAQTMLNQFGLRFVESVFKEMRFTRFILPAGVVAFTWWLERLKDAWNIVRGLYLTLLGTDPFDAETCILAQDYDTLKEMESYAKQCAERVKEVEPTATTVLNIAPPMVLKLLVPTLLTRIKFALGLRKTATHRVYECCGTLIYPQEYDIRKYVTLTDIFMLEVGGPTYALVEYKGKHVIVSGEAHIYINAEKEGIAYEVEVEKMEPATPDKIVNILNSKSIKGWSIIAYRVDRILCHLKKIMQAAFALRDVIP